MKRIENKILRREEFEISIFFKLDKKRSFFVGKEILFFLHQKKEGIEEEHVVKGCLQKTRY